VAECESVHLARWPRREPREEDAQEWSWLLGVRDSVNAAIEPLRAARQISTTAEAEVRIAAPAADAARLRAYGDELAAYLIVAGVEVVADARVGDGFGVTVRATTHPRCERCWTYRPDVAAAGERSGLCRRCVESLAAARRAGS
jgi:isoleucyl-tRNA synthetase